MSPVYIKTDIITRKKTVFGDTPDDSGVFQLFDGRNVYQDFSGVDPRFTEQIYIFWTDTNGPYRVYLSSEGKGGFKSPILKGVREKDIYTIERHSPIREPGEWRRVRDKSKKVIGWEPRKEYKGTIEGSPRKKER